MRLRRLTRVDILMVSILVLVWLLFFWRIFTPIEGDQASIKKGDFSGQFVAFAGYQYQRFAKGEVPLWDPYNNGGFPFIGDTQAAVFYPPRLITIGLSNLAGGWSYHALELEMTLHVLACSFFMYILMRRITLSNYGSPIGSFIGAIIFSYGGFMQSYPPLQLAVLEAAIWLPMAVLGIHEATRNKHLMWPWLILTGIAFGLSWMAGHPQTTWFTTYILAGYLLYRAYQWRYNWRLIIGGIALFGLLGGALAAVQLLPGVEYLMHTTRTGLGFDAKGNGFPFHDIIQFIFPNLVSQWSPLYVSLIGFTLVIITLWRRLPGSAFWGFAAIICLGISFGNNSPIYALFYNILPGLRFFRGQERGALIIAFSLALLAGMGATHLANWEKLKDFKASRRIQQCMIGLIFLCGIVLVLMFVSWLGNPDAFSAYLPSVMFSWIMALLTLALVTWLLDMPRSSLRQGLIAGLLVFDLFTLSMDSRYNYDPIPPKQQIDLSAPPLIANALSDADLPFRVDGYRALHDNFGSLYGVADMRGISPLFLDGPNAIINVGLINPIAWELFAVRYVYSDWEQMPVSSEIIMSGSDRYGTVNMHRLTNPRPFANLIYNMRMVANDLEARSLLDDSSLNLRQTVILEQKPTLPLDNNAPGNAFARITQFSPETFTIAVNTAKNAILSLAHPYYPGWVATMDNHPIPILRSYGALAAVEIPAGEHIVSFIYDPLSYKIGAFTSSIAWISVIGFAIVSLMRRKSYG